MDTLRERVMGLLIEFDRNPNRFAHEATDAILALVEQDRSELKKRLDELLSDAVPDKKWDKVFKGSAAEYLRHRAVHHIVNYADPDRGARLNQLANEAEQAEAREAKLVEAARVVVLETTDAHGNEMAPSRASIERLSAALALVKEEE